MVYLALTPNAAQAVVELARVTGAPVWVGSDGLTDAEFVQAEESGVKISRFIYPLVEAETAGLRPRRGRRLPFSLGRTMRRRAVLIRHVVKNST